MNFAISCHADRITKRTIVKSCRYSGSLVLGETVRYKQCKVENDLKRKKIRTGASFTGAADRECFVGKALQVDIMYHIIWM